MNLVDITSDLEFGSLSGLSVCSIVLPFNVGSSSKAIVLGQPQDHEGETPDAL
jgi:hypothetical protein